MFHNIQLIVEPGGNLIAKGCVSLKPEHRSSSRSLAAIEPLLEKFLK